MSETYVHDDGTPIRVKVGLHGIGAYNVADKQKMIARSFGEAGPDGTAVPLYVPPQSFDPTEAGLVAARQHSGSAAASSYDDPPIVEFIAFGRSHRYFVDDYAQFAPYFRQQLLSEARILGRAIQGYQAIAFDVLDGDGSFGGWMSSEIRAGADLLLRKGPPVKPADFNPLEKRVWDMSDRLHNGAASDYALLHEAGLEFIRIGRSMEGLRHRVQKRVESLIEAAGWGQKAAEEVEKESFAILDLYGQVRFVGKPGALAAYRCGLILLRSAARYAGERLVETPTRDAIRQAGAVVRAELPKAISALLLSGIQQGFANPLKPKLSEKAAEELIGLEIWLVFFTIDYFVFQVDELPPEQRAGASDRFLEVLAPKFAEEIVKSLVHVGLIAAVGDLPDDSRKRYWLERLAVALPVFINSTIDEVTMMRSLARSEKRPMYEILASELGWSIVRIVKSVGLALINDALKKPMQDKLATDREYYRALILSLKLALTEPDPGKVKATPDRPAAVAGPSDEEPEGDPESSGAPPVGTPAAPPKPPTAAGRPKTRPEAGPGKPVRQTKPGPDADGNIGMTKFRPAPGKTKAFQTRKTAKPDSAARKKVKPATRDPKSRAGKEFTEPEKRAEFEASAAWVQKKWRDDFQGKPPHYMCENCQFVSAKKPDFQVDHVWDIQHGGGKTPYTRAEVDRMIKDNDPTLLAVRGWQAAILCGGCNKAKNTKVGNAPGFIPRGKGYAYTRHDEDRNPDHMYQGPPNPND